MKQKLRDAWSEFTTQLYWLWVEVFARNWGFWVWLLFIVVAFVVAVWLIVFDPNIGPHTYHICVTHKLTGGDVTTVCHNEYR